VTIKVNVVGGPKVEVGQAAGVKATVSGVGPRGAPGASTWDDITGKPLTVSQAEAESGTATTDRLWTAQRVWQAIAVWWAASPEKTKLDGITAGATANAPDAQLRDRSTHTGTQPASTISDFSAAVVAAAPPTTNASLLTSGTLLDARLSSNIIRTTEKRLAVTWPVRAVHVGGLFKIGNGTGGFQWLPTTWPSTDFGSLATLATVEHPTEAVTVDLSSNLAALLAANPGWSLVRSSLEVALLDCDDRVVGWGTTESDGNYAPTHGNGGHIITLSVGDFPTIDPAFKTVWGLSDDTGTFAGFSSYVLNRPTPYKFIAHKALAAGRLPSTGAAAGTYTSVTVDAYGRVTAGSSPAVAWGSLTGVPSTFTPSAHSHAIADTTGLQTALDAKAPLASPTFTGTVSGVTKAMVGLGSVPNMDATARANHTGTQLAATISDFASAVVAAAPPTTNASLLTSGTLPAARLPATAVTAAAYGSASSVATFTVGADGRLTAAGSTTIAIAAGAVSGLASSATTDTTNAANITSGTLAAARLPLATYADTEARTSAAAIITPQRALDALFAAQVVDTAGTSNFTSGVTSNAYGLFYTVGGAGGGGSFCAQIGNPFHSPVSAAKFNGTTGNFLGRTFQWSKRCIFRFRIAVDAALTANTVFRLGLGKTTGGLASLGPLTQRGIYIEIRGSTGALWLSTHNGTSRTDTSAGITLVPFALYEIILESDGAGTARLFLDGTQVATSSGAPTTPLLDFQNTMWTIEGTTTDLAANRLWVERFWHFARPL
jgi:hypothetical protein